MSSSNVFLRNCVKNPCSEASNTIVCVWEATSAWNVPRDCTNDRVSGDQGTTWVTLADTLSGSGECADFVIENESSILSWVTIATISVGQSCCSEPLKVVGRWSSGHSSTSPAWNDGIDATTDESWSKSNWLSQVVECNDCCSLGDWNVICNGRWIVRWMVDIAKWLMSNATRVQQMCSNNDTETVLCASSSAMSSR